MHAYGGHHPRFKSMSFLEADPYTGVVHAHVSRIDELSDLCVDACTNRRESLL